MSALWWLPAIVAVTLFAEIVSGKALNPLKGMKPCLVGRNTMPGRYWTAIGLQTAFLGLIIWGFTASP
jgi:hypothetical protein